MTSVSALAAASLDTSRADRVARAGTDAASGFGTAMEAAEASARPVSGLASRSGELEPLARFESFVLGSFVETMLPKDEGFFGGGMAGNVWRSMMAERIGEEIARGGGVGIADLLRERAAGATGPAES